MVGRSWKKDGNEWQKHISVLLKRKYKASEFQEIPDRDKGDFGIEGFSRDGIAYQCYAAEEPLSTKALYEKQRTKITKNINKFKNNEHELKKIFGLTKIKCWALVVPRFESSQLVQHAEKKAEKVRTAHLPYVTDDFIIHIITEDYFLTELEELFEAGLARIHLKSEEIEQTQIDEWLQENDELIGNLDTKIRKINPKIESSKLNSLRSGFIKFFLNGQNLLEELRSEYPPLYEKAGEIKNNHESILEIVSNLFPGAPPEKFQDQIRNLEEEFLSQLPGLSKENIVSLTHEAISDWLLRCPLDFPEVN